MDLSQCRLCQLHHLLNKYHDPLIGLVMAHLEVPNRQPFIEIKNKESTFISFIHILYHNSKF